MTTSSFERAIIQILNKENVLYEREKTYDDLKNGHYRFDFYFPKLNVLCEVDGEQHYHFTKAFYKNRNDFLKAQERDRKKNAYALAHGIKLYRIPYTEVNNLTTFTDLLQDKFLVTSIYHNDRHIMKGKI